MFIAKYSSDGLLIWARGVGSIGYDYGRSIATVFDKFAIVIGDFKGTVTFGKGEINETILKSSAFSDYFIAKYAF
jgi:methenyltetrahydromethanopterin cyclohydrolase